MTLTKEWLLKTIAELEEERDATPGAVNEDAAKAIEVMKRALASLMAEPVAWTDEQELRDVEKYGCGYLFTANPVTPNADPHRVIKLYAAPPAPVSDSLMSELLAIAKKAADAADECAHAEWSDDSMEHSTAIADWERRAAMLQGADGNSPAHSGCRPAQNCISPAQCGNSPVIPDGWVLVPIEPTYQMCEAMGLQWESPRFPDRYKAMLAAVKK